MPMRKGTKKGKKTISASRRGRKSKTKGKWYLEPVPEGKEFILINGGRLFTIKDLADELSIMDESTYYYHTGQGRNDFANWVRDVFGLGDLSDLLLRAENRLDAAVKVYKYILENL